MENYTDIGDAVSMQDSLKAWAISMGAPTPTSAVRAACRQLLRECGIEAPPVPLKPLFDRLGVKIISNRRFHGDGLLRQGGSGFEAWIDPMRGWRRNRFTLAHELMHVLLLRSVKDVRASLGLGSQGAHDLIEQLCNQGAAELLLPRAMFERDLQLY